MPTDQDQKKYLKLFARDQSYKDRLLKIQSEKLIDDLKNTEEIKKIQILLEENQLKLETLSQRNAGIADSTSLIKELRFQVSDMQNELRLHKRKLVAYREAAKKFKADLDKAEETKKEFLIDVGLYDEYLSIKSAVKLTSQHKASTASIEEFGEFESINPDKLARLIDADKEPLTITLEPSVLDDEDTRTITVFSEIDDFDDLSLIKGIGPKFQILLNNEGVHTFEQIANWSEEEVEKRDRRLAFRGRIVREKWVEQAKQLMQKKDVG